MQVILGSGGVIADGLEEALSRYTDELRLVSRNPRMRRPENQICAADLTDAAQTARAVDGAEVAYLTVGLEYKTRVWERQWPLVMANVITACKASRTKLVFFDNVYPYGKVDGWMHEDTPADPVGRKSQPCYWKKCVR